MRKLAISLMLLTTSANASSIADLVDSASKQYNVDPKLVHAVIKTESGYNPKAYSHAGAAGLMQLMPDTAKRFGVSTRFDPAQNIDGGVRYLRVLLDMFGGNTKLAVAGYNAGEGAVQRYGNKIPPDAETQDYVKKVMSKYGDKQVSYYSYNDNKFTNVNTVKSKKIYLRKGFNVAAAKALANYYAPGSWKE